MAIPTGARRMSGSRWKSWIAALAAVKKASRRKGAPRPEEAKRIVLVGATASGKSLVALALADRMGAEIVGADSRQIYRGLEIGTEAPTVEDRARAPHHFVAFLDPAEIYSAGRYGREARVAAAGIEARGRTAIVAGGSGLYIRALLQGLDRKSTRLNSSHMSISYAVFC